MTISTKELLSQHCVPHQTALGDAAIAAALPSVPGWALEDGKLSRLFKFHNYYETLAFVNALAYVAHAQDHHPELTVNYNSCTVRYATDSVDQGRGGLSENDFICAAKVTALHQGSVAAA